MTKLYLEDAELYDIAFDWDVTAEVAWLAERLGVEVTGIDLSPQMLALARKRLGANLDLRAADMTSFDLGRTFDGGHAAEWPRVGRDATGGLLWHELRRR